ncbi:MAG TPA: hypothetical protein VMH89_00900 [Candidatus Acidoferrum sp.]|nr:hypothetical protein [Candidatus Acidoferrum sp.]
MRAIRVELLHHRERVPLVIRARFERTFFGVGSFAGVALLLGGLYLLRAAFQDPFGAADVRVLVAGFALALASFLLVYLVWPRGKMALARRERRSHALEKWDGPVLNINEEGVENRMDEEEALHLRKELPGPV